STAVFAERIDTVKTFSAAMQKEIPAVVILPDNFSTSKIYPVVYLLHVHGGSYGTKLGDITKLADTYGCIIVHPDGGYSSWYLDSPIDPSCRYETYISRELVEFIDRTYPVTASPAGRAITGISMGGHGALYLAFRHQDVFGAAGSMSGGVDFRPFPNRWDLAKRLGSYAENPDNWEKNTVVNMVHLLTPNSLALIFDCGTEDFFYKVNCQLHEKLLDRNIPHDFISRPGTHDYAYFSTAMHYQMLFFYKYFNSEK
ncbi:MAG: esterase family protein, partial [Tannerella sp.]|nr:esterase family protein [Tannerella sp.]